MTMGLVIIVFLIMMEIVILISFVLLIAEIFPKNDYLISFNNESEIQIQTFRGVMDVCESEVHKYESNE